MFKEYCPDVPTKCGLMVGIGETEEEVIALLLKNMHQLTVLLHQKNLSVILHTVTSLVSEISGLLQWFVQAILQIVNIMVNLFQWYAVKLILRKKLRYKPSKLKSLFKKIKRPKSTQY
ncbi:unnamed protein product [Oppiella nova]|uniref:Uncharacterized protein n=1 Tax=Oppiella nova TaxID=334625 RepID=A0A7R9QAT1_9ACAR|nr:unnamed protein product [Oppiella nova]CAG2160065.1 unnamed protein product [Oppiella nova]